MYQILVDNEVLVVCERRPEAIMRLTEMLRLVSTSLQHEWATDENVGKMSELMLQPELVNCVNFPIANTIVTFRRT